MAVELNGRSACLPSSKKLKPPKIRGLLFSLILSMVLAMVAASFISPNARDLCRQIITLAILVLTDYLHGLEGLPGSSKNTNK